ncbi:hypothetical protein Tco_1576588 [Tanacetum coccineum]
MLAPISAKALQEKVLKLHGIRKHPRSLSFGRTLFWIIGELSSLKKAAEMYSILCSSSSSSLSKLIGVLELFVDYLDCDHGSFGAFPSYDAKHRLEIRFHVEKRLRFLRGSRRKRAWEERSANGKRFEVIPRSVLVLPSNWFPLTRVKWLPLMANAFAVSGIVIEEQGVGATTRSATHMGSSSMG